MRKAGKALPDCHSIMEKECISAGDFKGFKIIAIVITAAIIVPITERQFTLFDYGKTGISS